MATFSAAADGRRSRAQRGEDVRYDLEIGFEEAVFGMNAEIQVPRMEPCDRCRGTGAEPGSGASTCPTCRGRGEVLYQQSFLSIRRTCNTCGGAGQIIRNPCGHCRGQGYRQVQRKLKVNIPAGVDEGTRLRLGGEGQPGANGGPPGDLYVFLKVKEHPFFERHENDLHCTIPLNIAQAALGCDIEVPTLEKPHKLEYSRGHAERRPVPPARQGRAQAQWRRQRRPLHPHRREGPRPAHARAAQVARATARFAAGG